MDRVSESLAEAARLLAQGRARETLSHTYETLDAYARHLAVEAGAQRELAGGDPDRLARISTMDLIDFLVEEGVLRRRQKAEIRDIHRQLLTSERERIGPSLERAATALRFTREFVDRNEMTARDVMRSPVLGIDRDKSIEDAIAIMRTRDVRELPILENGRPVRAIGTETIRRLLDEGASDLARTHVWDAAERGFPLVPPAARLPQLLHLLRTHPAVLVVENARAVGIVTDAELSKAVRRYP